MSIGFLVVFRCFFFVGRIRELYGGNFLVVYRLGDLCDGVVGVIVIL